MTADLQEEQQETLSERRRRWRRLRAVRPAGMRPPRIGVVNKKGGSGKTTSTVQLAGIFASWGLRARKLDADPQLASTTFWMGSHLDPNGPSLYEVYAGKARLNEVTYPTSVEGLLIVPSYASLDRVESERPPGTDTLLVAEFAASDELGIDVEIMDAAPSMNTVTVSVLAAATDLLITMKPSGLDSVGATEIDGPLALVKERLNPSMRIAAVLLVDADGRADFTSQVQEQTERDYPTSIVATVPHSVEAMKAPLAHQPMHLFAPNNPVTDAYYALAEALLTTMGFELKEAA
jgi:chromosome partitioning protein